MLLHTIICIYIYICIYKYYPYILLGIVSEGTGALGGVAHAGQEAPEIAWPNRGGFLPTKRYPLVMTNSLLWKMAIEIVSFPIENGDVQ